MWALNEPILAYIYPTGELKAVCRPAAAELCFSVQASRSRAVFQCAGQPQQSCV